MKNTCLDALFNTSVVQSSSPHVLVFLVVAWLSADAFSFVGFGLFGEGLNSCKDSERRSNWRRSRSPSRPSPGPPVGAIGEGLGTLGNYEVVHAVAHEVFHEAFYDVLHEVRHAVVHEVRPQVRLEGRPKVGCAARPEVRPQVRPEAGRAVRPEVGPQVRPEAGPQARQNGKVAKNSSISQPPAPRAALACQH